MSDFFNGQAGVPLLLFALVFGYLLGSIPFGLILTRMAGLGDVRSIGSGNIGATNVLRTGNKKLAAATLVLDMLKGTVAVLIAGIASPEAAIVAGFGAFLGHIFPVWLKFKGGKGVATYLGVLLGLFWQGALIFAAVWLISSLHVSLFFSRRPCRGHHRSDCTLHNRGAPDRSAFPCPDDHCLHQA